MCRRPSSTKQLTLDVIQFSSAAKLVITNSKKHLKQAKNCLFKNNQLYWIDLLKKNGNDCSHVDYNQLDDPLPFRIIYIYIIVALRLNRHSMILMPVNIDVYDFKW